jgi:hypothetical protein
MVDCYVKLIRLCFWQMTGVLPTETSFMAVAIIDHDVGIRSTKAALRH